MYLRYTNAKALVESAITIASERALSVSVAVADGHGESLAFGRMDNATLQSGVLAKAKAYTAARERQSTANLGKWARDTGKDMGYWVDPEITGMGGGVPIIRKSKVIGGMGVSGLTEEEDEQLVRDAMSQCGM